MLGVISANGQAVLDALTDTADDVGLVAAGALVIGLALFGVNEVIRFGKKTYKTARS